MSGHAATTLPLLAYPGFTWTLTLGITAAVGVVLLLLGFVLIGAKDSESRRRELGGALVSGAIFVLASGLVQASADIGQFRSSVTFTQDLSGFDPQGRSLEGFDFAGKKLHDARLTRADLRKADLTDSDLSDAHLLDAHLENAKLFYAQLPRAEFGAADLSGADLRGAKLATPDLGKIIVTGALVHQETCWGIPMRGETGSARFTPTKDGQAILDKLVGNLRPVKSSEALGHICTEGEGGQDPGTSAATTRIYICAKEPYLRRFTGDPQHDLVC